MLLLALAGDQNAVVLHLHFHIRALHSCQGTSKPSLLRPKRNTTTWRVGNDLELIVVLHNVACAEVGCRHVVQVWKRQRRPEEKRARQRANKSKAQRTTDIPRVESAVEEVKRGPERNALGVCMQIRNDESKHTNQLKGLSTGTFVCAGFKVERKRACAGT